MSNIPLEYYYSDSTTKIPIRDASHSIDPKDDPNLETMTYGLFSHCNKAMRKSVVEKGIPYILFCTNREGGIRVLTGYYHIAWYHEMAAGDYALAADEIRFVNPGFPLSFLNTYLEHYPIDRRFRTWKYIDQSKAVILIRLIKATSNATHNYVQKLNEINHTDPYTWGKATRLLLPQHGGK